MEDNTVLGYVYRLRQDTGKGGNSLCTLLNQTNFQCKCRYWEYLAMIPHSRGNFRITMGNCYSRKDPKSIPCIRSCVTRRDYNVALTYHPCSSKAGPQSAALA